MDQHVPNVGMFILHFISICSGGSTLPMQILYHRVYNLYVTDICAHVVFEIKLTHSLNEIL